jgi:hypothetical protein
LNIEKWSWVIEECPRMTPNDLSEQLWCLAARMGTVVDALPDARLAASDPMTNGQYSIPNSQ